MSFIADYIKSFHALTNFDPQIERLLLQLKEVFVKCSQQNGQVIFIGNGGSAAISSHVAVDLSKNAGIRSINFNEADLITCLANDYGHDNWMQAALNIYAKKNDTVVLISSSGKSANVVNAAKWCVENDIELITLSGMDKNNPLLTTNKVGINMWVDSKAYNLIEMTHQFWLLCVTDLCIGKTVYSA